jgi:zinc transporter ZupT
MRNELSDLFSGAIAMASFVVALFFLRFWRSSRDRFFLYFALSFGIEGVHRIVSALTYDDNEDSPLHYLVRLLAYGLILWAILEKNLPARGARREDGR